MNSSKKRYLAIDTFRGMVLTFMIIVNTPGSWSFVYSPLEHSKWHGCTPTDLVFPFFIYVVGLSMAFSFSKYKKEEKNIWIKKVFKRVFSIFLVGLLLNWFPFYIKPLSELRFMGVLQRIALAYGGAALLIIFLQEKKKILISIPIILLTYWLVLYLGGAHPYTLENNLVGKVDLYLFGKNHIYGGFGIPFDPEGLISTLPGIPHVLIGYLIGDFVKSNKDTPLKIIKSLIILSGLLLVIGIVWDLIFPINKPIWTSSYVLFTSGWATLILAGLIFLIDFKGQNKWTLPFRVFGTNPLAIFVLSGVFVRIFIYMVKIDGKNLYKWLFENIFQPYLGDYNGSLTFALSFTFMLWIIAWILYKKDIQIKL